MSQPILPMRLLPFCFCVLLAATAPALADTLYLSELTSGAGVVAGEDVDSQGLHLLAPDIPNPLDATLSGTLGASHSQSDIDLAWASSFASFLVHSDQQAAGLSTSTVYTIAPGSIRVSVIEPLPLHISASWSYELPADLMMTRLRVYVFDPDQSLTLFSEVQTIDTFSGQPASGIATITGDVVLPANATWSLQYAMELWAFSGMQGHSATGNGFVEFTITPEASTLALLAASSLLVLRRRTRRSC